jgi:hypothetical protein
LQNAYRSISGVLTIAKAIILYIAMAQNGGQLLEDYGAYRRIC